MILTLLWLTVSMPVVYGAQILAKKDKIAASHTINDIPTTEEDNCNPFGNNAEEKAPAGSFSEEYHSTSDHQELFHLVELLAAHHRYQAFDEYVAFHGEMLCPPPNLA